MSGLTLTYTLTQPKGVTLLAMLGIIISSKRVSGQNVKKKLEMRRLFKRLWGYLSSWFSGDNGDVEPNCIDADMALVVFYDAFDLTR